MSQFDVSVEIDARGLLCPLPVLKARKKLLAMKEGQILRVLATDPIAVIDLPNFCREAGHEFLVAETAIDHTAYLIRRGVLAVSAPDDLLGDL